ncbi:hypothetical protein B0H14DRAFT_3123787 [Mycena olivaceomarginata]|nr:hypothetical protein B0H14DRAFT_3123787 [Mycena olivaceomarginata]
MTMHCARSAICTPKFYASSNFDGYQVHDAQKQRYYWIVLDGYKIGIYSLESAAQVYLPAEGKFIIERGIRKDDPTRIVYNDLMYLVPTLTSTEIPQSSILAARKHHALDGVHHRGLWYCGHQPDAADGAGMRLGLGEDGWWGLSEAAEAVICMGWAVMRSFDAPSWLPPLFLFSPILTPVSSPQHAPLDLPTYLAEWPWPAIWMLPVDNSGRMRESAELSEVGYQLRADDMTPGSKCIRWSGTNRRVYCSAAHFGVSIHSLELDEAIIWHQSTINRYLNINPRGYSSKILVDVRMRPLAQVVPLPHSTANLLLEFWHEKRLG